MLPKVRQIQDYHVNAAKRRCVELDPAYHNHSSKHSDKIEQIPQDPQIDITEKTTKIVSLQASSQSNAAQAFQVPQLGQGGNGISKDAMNESLKIALHQQGFPHVNQRLAHYRLSIDNATRGQLGNKVKLLPPQLPTNLLKRVGQNTFRRSHEFSRRRKRQAFRQLPLPLGPSDPPISADEDDVDIPARRLIVKLRIGKPLGQHSTPDIRNSAHAPTPRQSIPELGENSHSVRQSARHSTAKEIKTAAVVMHPLSNAGNPRRNTGAQTHQKPVTSAKSGEIHYQIENLQLAGLDERVSRPYLSWEYRKDIERGLALIQTKQEPHAELSEAEFSTLQGSTVHVDFCQDEIECMIPVIKSVTGSTTCSDPISSRESIENLMLGCEKIIPKVVAALNAAKRTRGITAPPESHKYSYRGFYTRCRCWIIIGSTKDQACRIKYNTFKRFSSAIKLYKVYTTAAGNMG